MPGFKASLCVDEMERLPKSRVPNPVQREPADLITAFEWLLWDHGCTVQGDCRSYPTTLEEVTGAAQMDVAPDLVRTCIS